MGRKGAGTHWKQIVCRGPVVERSLVRENLEEVVRVTGAQELETS